MSLIVRCRCCGKRFEITKENLEWILDVILVCEECLEWDDAELT